MDRRETYLDRYKYDKLRGISTANLFFLPILNSPFKNASKVGNLNGLFELLMVEKLVSSLTTF